MTETQAYDCLRQVIDPELHVNIVDLGLIYKVTPSCPCDRREAGHVHVLLTLTTPTCPMAGSFDFMIKDSFRPVLGDATDSMVFTELTFDPPWTKDMMSDELKAEFGMDDWYQ